MKINVIFCHDVFYTTLKLSGRMKIDTSFSSTGRSIDGRKYDFRFSFGKFRNCTDGLAHPYSYGTCRMIRCGNLPKH